MLGTLNKGFYAIKKNFQNERLVMGSMAMEVKLLLMSLWIMLKIEMLLVGSYGKTDG